MSTHIEQPTLVEIVDQHVESPEPNFVVSTVASVFYAYGPAWDFIRVLIFGGLLEFLRRLFLLGWRKLVNRLCITVTLDNSDESYCEPCLSSHLFTSFTDYHVDWMMMWLSKRPEWTSARELSISTHSFGVGALATLIEGEAEDHSQNKIRFLPSHGRLTSLWYRSHYIRLSRDVGFDGKETLTME